MAGPCVWLCVLVSVVTVGATTPAPPPQTGTCGPTLSSFLEAVGHLPDIMDSLQYIQSTLDHLTNQLKSTLIQEMPETLRVSRPCPGQIIEEGEPRRPRHCQDLLEDGDSGQGVRLVYPYPEKPDEGAAVYCDHTVDGGGWTVVQRRTNSTTRENFYRTWPEYQLGFGDLTGEMWSGLDLLHTITNLARQELRIQLYSMDGEHRWAKYDLFNVSTPGDNYRLSIGRYTGDAGDAMTYSNGAQFSTHDADHDTSLATHCAQTRKGAWWYKFCTQANLNGYQYEGDKGPTQKGIYWFQWKGADYSLHASMMIRPAV